MVVVSEVYGVNSLLLEAGAGVDIRYESLVIDAGPIQNDGTILISASLGPAYLRIAAPELEFLGSGSLVLDNLHATVRNKLFEHPRVTNGAGHTIRGAGFFGLEYLQLSNAGTVRADLPEGLVVSLDAHELNVNTGIMEASAGSTLYLTNCGTLLNSGGVVRANDGSKVWLTGTNFVGGQFTTEGTGVVEVGSAPPPVLLSPKLSGLTRITYGGGHFGGTVTNNGIIEMISYQNSVECRFVSSVVQLSGSGTLSMSNSSNNIIRNAYGDVVRLVHGASHTIRGSGALGVDSLQLTNYGRIRADQSVPLIIDLYGGAPNYNAGIIEVVNGSTISMLSSGAIDNTGGVIRVGDGSVMVIEGTSVSGGQLLTEGTGKIKPWTNAPTLSDLLIDGHVYIGDERACAFKGTVENLQSIELGATLHSAEFRVASTELLMTGSGTLQLGNNVNNVIRNSYGAPNQLTNDTSHTIRGAGQIGANTLGIVNNGAIVADLRAGLTIDPQDSRSFVNHGSLQVVGQGVLTLSAGQFENDGAVLVGAGRSLNRTGDFLQYGGSTRVDGTLALADGACIISGGLLTGGGRVFGNVSNVAGIVEPGSSIGQLEVSGSYVQGPTGRLNIEIGGTTPDLTHDTLKVNGLAVLDGVLQVSFSGGTVPPNGSQFTVLASAQISGRFQSIQAPPGVEVSYSNLDVVVRIVSGQSADLNADGFVDSEDLGLLIGSWGPCNRGSCTGDLNGDGTVDGTDLGLLLGAWQRNPPAN